MKKFSIVMTVVSVVGMSLTTVFFISGQIEKQMRIEVEKQLQDTTETKKVAEIKLEEMTGIKEHLNAKWEKEKIRTKGLEQELAEAEEYSAKLKKDLEDIRSRLEVVIKAKGEIEGRYKGPFSESREEKVINIEKIVITAEAPLGGRILVVNKEYEFIVIDLGDRDDLEVGEMLLVYRDDELIGKARVEKVYENVSVATILPELKGHEITNDDTIKRL